MANGSICRVLQAPPNILHNYFLQQFSSSAFMYEKELLIAQLAVQRASLVLKLILRDYSQYLSTTITKEDHSPVTIADFAVQSAVISAVTDHFPNDVFVAEESPDDVSSRKDLLALIRKYIGLADAELKLYDLHGYSFKPLSEDSQILSSLKKGGFTGGPDRRFWILDPIDGTKGFLRGDQFAVCLALMDQNKIRIGVNGCPNIPVDIKASLKSHDFGKGGFNLNEYLRRNPEKDRGLMFSAAEGKGLYVSRIFESLKPLNLCERISMNNNLSSIKESVVVEGVEVKHSNHEAQSQIKSTLSIPENRTVNLDSQCKYSLLAYGVADVYLRLPVDPSYREKIWDHSSGYLLVHESGGVVSDMNGNDLDFTKGKYLQSQGVIAGSKQFHSDFVKAVKGSVKL